MIDHNGHMHVAYFVLAFDEATDAVYEEWGIGPEYPERSGCSVFTLGMNVDYFAEVFEGDPIRIDTQCYWRVIRSAFITSTKCTSKTVAN